MSFWYEKTSNLDLVDCNIYIYIYIYIYIVVGVYKNEHVIDLPTSGMITGIGGSKVYRITNHNLCNTVGDKMTP